MEPRHNIILILDLSSIPQFPISSSQVLSLDCLVVCSRRRPGKREKGKEEMVVLLIRLGCDDDLSNSKHLNSQVLNESTLYRTTGLSTPTPEYINHK